MAQIIDEPNWGGVAGQSFSSGLQNALSMLAQYKMQDLMEKKATQRKDQERNRYSTIFQKSGYSPEISEMLTALAEINPKGFFEVLKNLGASEDQNNDQNQNYNQMINQQEQEVPEIDKSSALLPQQQLFSHNNQQQESLDDAGRIASQIPNVPQQNIASKPQTFAQQLNKGATAQKSKTVAQEKHEDDLIAHKDRLVDTIQTARRMKEALEKGATYGLVASAKSFLAPSLLDEVTEQLDKDSSHLINLTSGEIKGVPSKYRVALIEKEKPGVKHSSNVNKQILNRTIKSAEDKLKELESHYSFLKTTSEELEPGEQLPQFKSKAYKGYDAYEENGKYYLWDKQNNEYRAAKLKGK